MEAIKGNIIEEEEKESEKEYQFPEDYKNWKHFENDQFAFMSIVTHECRSSITKDILAPFARFTDNEMSIVALQNSGKLALLHFLTKIAGGKHIGIKNFIAKRACEAIISPSSKSYFNVDGEIYDDDEAHVVTLPGFLNLMGRVHKLTKAEEDYAHQLENSNGDI